MLPMTITCRPSRSFFLFFLFVSFFMFAKTIHPSLSMRKTFSLYTYIPIHDKLFLYTHALKTLSLYINTAYIKNSIPVQRFLFRFSTYNSWFISKLLYIHSLLTQNNFFSHIIYTYTKSFHTVFFLLHIKNSFLFFIYRHDICSQRLFFFNSWCYHDFCSFYF